MDSTTSTGGPGRTDHSNGHSKDDLAQVAVIDGGECHIVCSGGQYHQYRWAWTTDHSNSHSEDDLAQVAVIDGGKCHIQGNACLL